MIRALREGVLVGRDMLSHLATGRRVAGLLALAASPAALLLYFRWLEPDGALPPDRARWWTLLWLDAANVLLQGVGLWICLTVGPRVASDDPLEEGGLSYLLTRPVPKWRIFAARLTAGGALCAACLLAGQIAVALAAMTGTGAGAFASPAGLRGLWHVGVAQTVAAFLYTAIGALLALVTSRPAAWGLAYFFFGEMILAGTHGILATWTLMFHLRSLVARGLPNLHEILQKEMIFPTVTLSRAAETSTALAVLIGAAAAATALAIWQFCRREWAPPRFDR